MAHERARTLIDREITFVETSDGGDRGWCECIICGNTVAARVGAPITEEECATQAVERFGKGVVRSIFVVEGERVLHYSPRKTGLTLAGPIEESPMTAVGCVVPLLLAIVVVVALIII